MNSISSVEIGATRPIHPEERDSFSQEVLEATQAVPVSGQFNTEFGHFVKGVDLGFLEPSTRTDSLGRLDHYEILEVRGQGGFGIVLRAYDEKLHRIVALKILPPHIPADMSARRRFTREAQAAAAIQNEHVIGIFAVENGPCPYIAMEYVNGPSLQERIKQDGTLTLEEILRIGHQAALGLAAAHEQGLIHRDIKPGNILLENGAARVKITDFGLARAVDDVGLTQSGVVHGTPAYMAPEQTSGDQIDHRADLFSLGSVLYTMATGRMPFQASNSLAMLKSVKDDKPNPIRVERPDLPDWFESLVTKLHAKDPDERFQSARELADLLAEHLASVRTLGSRYRPVSSPRRSRGRWWMATPIIAVMALIGGAQIFGKKSPATVPETKQVETKAIEPPLAGAPLKAAEVQDIQCRWADHLQLKVEHANSIGMKLRLLPPGEYGVLSDPKHIVHISNPFYIGEHEVTVAQFREFADASNYKTHAERDPLGGKAWNPVLRRVDQHANTYWRNPTFPQKDDHPVCCVTWQDAVAFCKWLSEKESKHYRLPTEAEWEYACRAGTNTTYHYGLVLDVSKMNVGMRGTVSVGSFPPNAFGLYDMHGNVYEWCIDAPRTHEGGVAIDPRGPDEGLKRVVRSGCYSSGISPVTRSDFRASSESDHAYAGNGFRVVLEVR